MLSKIVPQVEEKVKCSIEIEECHKPVFCDGVCFNHFVRLRRIKEDLARVKCADEWCHRFVFRAGLCFYHFVMEEIAAWNDYIDEIAQAHLVSVGRG